MNNTYHPTEEQFSRLRRDAETIKQATAAGTRDFELLAKLHQSQIFTTTYYQIGSILSDTWVIRYGRSIITEQNMQYYPMKVRFFYVTNYQPVENVIIGRGVSKGEIMTLAYGGSYTNVDAAIPCEYYMRYKQRSILWVMDYNGEHNHYGHLRHLAEVAGQHNINMTFDYSQEGIIYPNKLKLCK